MKSHPEFVNTCHLIHFPGDCLCYDCHLTLSVVRDHFRVLEAILIQKNHRNIYYTLKVNSVVPTFDFVQDFVFTRCIESFI